MADEERPLVELSPAPVIYCKGLGRAEVINGDLHCKLFNFARASPAPDAPIVRAVNLQIVMPVMEAIQALHVVAGALGLDRAAKALAAQLRRKDGG